METLLAGGVEEVSSLGELGVRAFTTTRAAGSFGLQTDEPARDVFGRWSTLVREMRTGGRRLATSTQVHGAHVLVHAPAWEGWLRAPEADGHIAHERGTALVVTIADCVPVFIAHPSGTVALLHSGWRGTASRIVERAIDVLEETGRAAPDLTIHLGPAICGECYEVSADVYMQLTGADPGKPTNVDLRSLIAAHARARGVRRISVSDRCTRCDNDRFFSHRAGDSGRQVAVIQFPIGD